MHIDRPLSQTFPDFLGGIPSAGKISGDKSSPGPGHQMSAAQEKPREPENAAENRGGELRFPFVDVLVDEWKPQLAAAILCGIFGLAGFFLGRAHLVAWSRAAFIAAYLAGGWYTAQEVWERLRQRAIDVHFLMLAVAAGAACINA